jgi:hypothetical protein
MTAPRIFADFNNCDQEYRIRLNAVGSLRDIAMLPAPLTDGALVTLADGEGEFEVDATVAFTGKIWIATPIWETKRSLVTTDHIRRMGRRR